MSIVAGCDVGSLATKAVIMERRRVLAAVVVRSGPKPGASACEALDQALAQCGRTAGEVACCVGTGYGREKIGFVDDTLSEISCHAKGARFLVPSAHSIIDIGGQDCKVIQLDAAGRLVKFVTNDKCASGTGRFLEVMAKVMHLPVERLGALSLQSRDPITLASMCTVWAQADVIKHINARRPAEDICAGINTAMANRVAMLANALRLENDICMTGGVAKNKGVVNALARILGKRIKEIKPLDPQLTGALGAALIAAEKAGKEKSP
jgi:predicted CoA-substrate-specific enzyme activase